MAANEAIIRAAGQRYTPVKMDYSPWLEGLSNVSKVLVEKRKQKQKTKIAGYKAVDENFKKRKASPYANYMKNKSYEMVNNGEDPTSFFQDMNSDLDDYAELQELAELTDNWSSGSDPLFENYMNSLGDELFNNSIYVKSGDNEVELNIDIWLDPTDNRFKISSIDGTDYVTPGEILAMAKTMARTTDGNVTSDLLDNFIKETSNYSGKDSESDFVNAKGKAMGAIDDLFSQGALNKKGEVEITANRVKTSSMIDKEYNILTEDRTDYERVNFVDYYLTKTDSDGEPLIPIDLALQYSDFIGKAYFGDHFGEDITREMKKKFAASIMEEDDNIEEDFKQFYKMMLDRYQEPAEIKFKVD